MLLFGDVLDRVRSQIERDVIAGEFLRSMGFEVLVVGEM